MKSNLYPVLNVVIVMCVFAIIAIIATNIRFGVI
jgi:hypothetical protein